jgi:hypothetical protein
MRLFLELTNKRNIFKKIKSINKYKCFLKIGILFLQPELKYKLMKVF